MPSDSMVRRLAVAQRKRLLASILGAVETAPWYGSLSPAQRTALRDKILGSVNAYHDFMLDVIHVGEDDVTRNAHALELITAVHASQRRLEAELRDDHA